MGVLYIREVEGPAHTGVWQIAEEAGELYSALKLSDTEEELYASFRTEPRRLQWLAYRRLLREMTGPGDFPVRYDEAGKPYLAGRNWHISVTHTDRFAGVILSKKVRVGIDMEKIRPRIEKVKEKFLSDEELDALAEDFRLDYLTLGWCAKEALYKLYGYRSMDFRENMRLEFPARLDGRPFPGKVVLHGRIIPYRLFYERRDDLFTVWVSETGQPHEEG